MEIKKIAHLARIDLSEAEAAEYGAQLDQILEFVEKLDGADIEGIEPTAHAAPVYDIYREDEEDPSRVLDRSEVLGNAPATAHDQIRMPKVIE